jgi:hypothetical protein
LQEPWGKSWDTIEPPPAAKPYYTHDGLMNRPYHTQFGGGTGVRGETAATSRWCQELEEVIEETACSSCANWGEHDGDGIERCYHDSKQKEQDREEGEDET